MAIVDRVKIKGWVVRVYRGEVGGQKRSRKPMSKHRVAAYDREHARRKVVEEWPIARMPFMDITATRMKDGEEDLFLLHNE